MNSFFLTIFNMELILAIEYDRILTSEESVGNVFLGIGYVQGQHNTKHVLVLVKYVLIISARLVSISTYKRQ